MANADGVSLNMGKPIETAADALRKHINIGRLVDSLEFDDAECSIASQEQAKLFYKSAVYKVQRSRERQKKEAALKLLRSNLARKYRTQLREVGQRVTDKEIEEKLLRNKEVIEAMAQLSEAELVEDYGKLLVEALRMRKDSLKIVSELIGAEVYVSRRMMGEDTHLTEMRKKLKEKYPGRVLKEERRER